MPGALNLKAAVWAGIVAGVVFMMLEMALVMLVQGQSPWGPPRMMAAMVMGESVLPPPGTFDAMIMMVAMTIHLILSIILGAILGFFISKLSLHTTAAIISGTLFGIAVYFINFYIFTAIFPWFAMARGAVSIFAHAVFGLVLGWVYHVIAARGINGGGRSERGHIHADDSA